MTNVTNLIPKSTSFELRSLTGSIGADIVGTDLNEASDKEIALLRVADSSLMAAGEEIGTD